MRRTKPWLVVLILLLIIGSAYFLYPTIKLWSMSDYEKAQAKEQDPAGFSALEKKGIKLGLDLKGGMHVVLEVDKSLLKEEEKKDAVDRALEIIRNRVDQFGVNEPLIQKQGEDRIIVELPGVQEVARAESLIGRTAELQFKLLEDPTLTMEIIGKIDNAMATEKKGTLFEKKESKAETKAETKNKPTELFSKEKPDSSLEDTLASEGETEKPFSSLFETVQLGSTGFPYFLVRPDDKLKVEKILNNPKIVELVPVDAEFAWSTRPENAQGGTAWLLYLLKKRVEFSGKYLTDARPRYDEVRRPEVSFTLTKEGGRKFAQVTGANVNKPLAIVLDGRIESAPEIQSRIRDQGRITMGGSSSIDDAKDLAIILRAGALPAPVKIIANQVVGPSLGQDSINKGVLAGIIGFGMVFFFMAIYYRISGLIADIALIFNIFYLLAFMSAGHFTLTLPGIAGIILTMGMSVDSNVLIFERIREELRTGKTIRASIEAGYKRALLTVVDSHVTTLITALVLFLFGTGQVKGFAVSLSLGVSISLFTALVITKVIFDIRKTYRKLSI
jgi:SecD/SecF fusion protein